MAGKSEIVRLVGAAMLDGPDVLKVVGEFGEVLMEVTILTAVSSSGANASSGGGVDRHQADAVRLRRRRALSLRIEMKSIALMMDSYSA